MFKTLKTITYEQAKQHILPDDAFLEVDKENYWKVKHIYKAMAIGMSITFILLMLIINALNNHDGNLINRKDTILTPFFPYINFLVYSLGTILMLYFWYKFNKTDIYSRFYQKKYMVVKNLSINMIIVSIGMFMMVFFIIASAPLGGAVIAIVLLTIFLTINGLVIYADLTAEIGKFSEGFEKNWIQKITGNLIPFFATNALVFYVVYKMIWAIFPDIVHGIGDSTISSSIGSVGIPLLFSVFPFHYMIEKIINGYLVNKYYDQFKVDYDLKE